MIVHDVIQGSQEWLDLRSKHFTASEASMMMGASPYTKRSELLTLRATGGDKNFSEWAQKNLLDKGHEIEESARSIAELMIGQELYPCTATSDEEGRKHLLASFDGVTISESIIWECKSWNKAKADHVTQNGTVPMCDFWQVVQQLVVSRAERCLYMVTDGTEENTVHCWMELTENDEQTLLAHWERFGLDVARFGLEDLPQQDAVGEAVEALPAVYVQVTGDLCVKDNFVAFESALRRFLGDVLITDPRTDQDFASLDLQIKAMKRAEAALDAAEEQMLAQVSDVNDLKRTKDTLHELVRKNRLASEKLLSAQKDKIKLEIKQAGESAYRAHIDELSATLPSIAFRHLVADFAGVMKGKRTISSLKDAVDTELARAIVEANAVADKVRVNVELLKSKTEGFAFLFIDHAALAVHHDAAALIAVIEKRINDHKIAEEAKLEKERERIRQEEIAKIEAENARKQREAEQAERERLRKEEAAKAAEEAGRLLEEAKAEAEAKAKAAAKAEEEKQAQPLAMPKVAALEAASAPQARRIGQDLTIELRGAKIDFTVRYFPGEAQTDMEPGTCEEIEWEAQDKAVAALIEHFDLSEGVEELLWAQIAEDIKTCNLL